MNPCNQRLFRYQAALFVVLFVSLFASAHAESVTFTGADYQGQGGTASNGKLATSTKNGITITSTKAYYVSDTEIREYMAGTITFSGAMITKIELTSTALGDNTNGPGKIKLTSGESGFYSYFEYIGTWQNKRGDSEVVLTCSNAFRWSQIVVTYEPSVTPTQQFTIQWYVDGEVVNTDICDEGTALALPEGVDPSEACEGRTFVGWTDAPIPVMTDIQPSTLFTEATGTVTEDKNYYAVFAEVDEETPPTSTTGYTTACSGGVIRDNLIVGDFGTICLPQKMVNVTGAEFYGISHKEMNGNVISALVLEEVTVFEAGTPYLFKASATAIIGELQGDVSPAKSVNGLVGVDVETFLDAVEQYGEERNFYLIRDNHICLAQAYCGVHAHYAYIRMNDVPDEPVAPATSARRVSMAVEQSETVPTVLPETENKTAPQKVIERGRFYIYRDGVKRDAQGQVVSVIHRE